MHAFQYDVYIEYYNIYCDIYTIQTGLRRCYPGTGSFDTCAENTRVTRPRRGEWGIPIDDMLS